MAVVESRDLNGAVSKVAIGPPVINDGNIADLGRDHISYLQNSGKTGVSSTFVLSRIGFFQII